MGFKIKDHTVLKNGKLYIKDSYIILKEIIGDHDYYDKQRKIQAEHFFKKKMKQKYMILLKL